MATAIIQSLVNGINPVVGASRDDLRAGDTITLTQVGGVATTYAWSIAFKPEDKDRNPSAATLAGNVFGPGPVTFVVDNEGPYLIRLVIDAGLPTQDEQYVRLRYDTFFGDLKLVAAGERRDGTGIIPVDVSAEGWANDQNFNLNRLLCLIQHVSASGRIIYVDANRGKDNLGPQNDPSVAEGYADFSSINSAILAAETDADYNGGIPPSATQPVILAVRPGFYEEDVTFKPYVHVIGWPSTGGGVGTHPDYDRSVTIRCENAGGPPAGTHTANLPNLGEYCMVANVVLENTGATTNALLRKIGEGDAYFINCEMLQSGGGAANQGAGVAAERGGLYLHDCRVIQEDTFSDDSLAFLVDSAPGNTAALTARDSMFIGTSIGQVDPDQEGGDTAEFSYSKFQQVGAGAGSYAIQTWAELLSLEDCELTVDPGSAITDGIEANPDAAGAAGDLVVCVRRTLLGDTSSPPTSFLGIQIDDTNVTGTSRLKLGSSEYGTLSITGPVVQEALTIGTSLFYDNTISGLLSVNVQDAIDEIAGGGGGGAAPNNAPFITHAVSAALSDNRVLSNGVGTTINNSGVDDGSIAVDLTNTGVAAAAYTRTDLTVDAQGRITLAASGLIEFPYSRQMLVPVAPFVAPLVVQEFDIITGAAGFSFAGGLGALNVYLNVGAILAPGDAVLQVYLGPAGALLPYVDPAAGPAYSPLGYDLSFLPASPSLTPVAIIPGAHSFPAGTIILIEVSYLSGALPAVGTDGLTVSLTGSV